mgnify:CR=1 FL=1
MRFFVYFVKKSSFFKQKLLQITKLLKMVVFVINIELYLFTEI